MNGGYTLDHVYFHKIFTVQFVDFYSAILPSGISFDPGARGPALFLYLKKLWALLKEGVVPLPLIDAEGEGPGCGVLFLGLVVHMPLLLVLFVGVVCCVFPGLLPVPLALVGVVFVLLGEGVVLVPPTGDLVVDLLLLVRDTLDEGFVSFFSTLNSLVSS